MRGRRKEMGKGEGTERESAGRQAGRLSGRVSSLQVTMVTSYARSTCESGESQTRNRRQ